MIDQGMNALTQGKVSINRMSVKNILKLLSLKKISLKQQDNVRTKVGQLVNKSWELTTTQDWFHKIFFKLDSAWVWSTDVQSKIHASEFQTPMVF